MSITIPEPIAKRGQKDARRHREKQREALRENLPEIIAEEAIITQKRGKTVKVPIRSLEIPNFRPGARNRAPENGDGQRVGGAGVGQGPGNPGDVIDRRPPRGQRPGPEAGDEPGQDYIETEIELEELVAMMLEDLGLPNLEKKEVPELESVIGLRISGIQKSGPRVLLDPVRSSKKPFGRFFAFLQMLMDETGRDELTSYSALKQADGDFSEALRVLEDPAFSATEEEVNPFAIYHQDDLRFHKLREDVQTVSNAVIIAMMDVSGSMTTMKKYMARSVLFWLVEFLRTIYTKVEIRFIVHHTNARLVPEEEFFHTMESGGTRCASAYGLASSLIDSQYSTSQWNVYAFHFSDGEDWEPKDSMREASKLFQQGIRMFGYGEIHVDESYRSYGNLFPAFREAFPITDQQVPIGGSTTVDGTAVADGGTMSVSVGSAESPFLGVVIEDKKHIWPALREFLNQGRWS